MAKPLTPEVTWYERSSDSDPEKNYVSIFFAVPDVTDPNNAEKEAQKAAKKANGTAERALPDPNFTITPTSLSFSAYSNSKKIKYHVDMELYREVVVNDEELESKHEPKMPYYTGSGIRVKLIKKDLDAEYWDRLLKGGKVHYLRPDFENYVDVAEQEDPKEEVGGPEGLDFSKLGGGMEGMGGMGGMPGMEALQGMGGMPGMEALQGMGGMGGAGGQEEAMEGDDEEDMPELEGEEETAASTSKPKIEEVA
ncbi:hypothetical protein FQN49_006977 [Arthroderma sp. PD_2]|nr:hypothetical protein FQN49_006977 [Arthroderma sp. PD_2]